MTLLHLAAALAGTAAIVMSSAGLLRSLRLAAALDVERARTRALRAVALADDREIGDWRRAAMCSAASFHDVASRLSIERQMRAGLEREVAARDDLDDATAERAARKAMAAAGWLDDETLLADPLATAAKPN